MGLTQGQSDQDWFGDSILLLLPFYLFVMLVFVCLSVCVKFTGRHWRSFSYWLKSVKKSKIERSPMSVADLHKILDTPLVQLSFILMQFLGKVGQIIGWRPSTLTPIPFGWSPSFGKYSTLVQWHYVRVKHLSTHSVQAFDKPNLTVFPKNHEVGCSPM